MRLDWQYQLQFYTADQLIFVDESGSYERTGDRDYGYALHGVKARVERWLQSRERYSVLPAYTIDGYIANLSFDGTCNSSLFAE